MTEQQWPYPDVPPRPAEALLIEHLPRFQPTRCICTSLGRAQWGFAAARRWPDALVRCLYLDLYQAEQARALVGDRATNLTVACADDFPPDEVDLAALPSSSTGEAELTRDLLQSAHDRLSVGGWLLASTDNPRDTWLAGEMGRLCASVERTAQESGVVYAARKDRPLKKRKHFDSTFAFRDSGRLFQATTRPGVFSHRHVDPGARRLMEAMSIRPGDRVLDIGCGWGAVALAAAGRASDVQVLAIDSNARAVSCTRQNALVNQLPNVSVVHSATGDCDQPGSYDLVLANPPYFAGFRIAELFLTAAHRALRTGGQILAVTKLVDWYLEAMPRWYERVEVGEAKGYFVVRGVKGA